jgi:hypothetical protein
MNRASAIKPASSGKGSTMGTMRTKDSIGITRYVLYWSVGTALTLVGYYVTRVLRSTDIID